METHERLRFLGSMRRKESLSKDCQQRRQQQQQQQQQKQQQQETETTTITTRT